MLQKPIDRRSFICLAGKISAAIVGASLLPACTPQSNQGSNNPDSDNFYIRNKSKIMDEVEDLMGYASKVAKSKYGEDLALKIKRESIEEFDRLLPELPYIGGYTNDLTTNLYQSAACLAFYRKMMANGKTLEETGEILYRATELMAGAIPLSGMVGSLSSSDAARKKLAVEADLSHQKQYPEDWVFDFIDGDGKDFDYGIDYTECGICKYFSAQGATELTPYLCLLDFPFSVIMNTGLERTTTLGHGGNRCDFRYKMDRPVQMEWTPDFLKKD